MFLRIRYFFLQATRAGVIPFLKLIKLFPLYIRFSKSRLNSLNTGLPWFTFEAITMLDKTIRKDFRVFEYGTGGSTIYFARRADHITVVEHDDQWLELVKSKLLELNIKNVDLELAAPIHDDRADALYFSTTLSSEGHKYSFEKYCKVIDRYPDDYFDLISIDGRARVGAFKHAFGKLKRDGVLVIDNSERLRYISIKTELEDRGWKERKFFGPGPYSEKFWQTSIWMYGVSES